LQHDALKIYLTFYNCFVEEPIFKKASKRMRNKMQKVGIILIVLGMLAAIATNASERGAFLFESYGCDACHRLESRSSGTPSLPELARAYQNKQKQLILYLKGDAGPIVQPEKAGMMKRQLEKTSAMSDDDRTALADYINASLTPQSSAAVNK
jgi:cytochrome c